MPRISINGANLEVVEKGQGTPVVLVHGSASDYRTWGNQIKEFSKNYRVIAYSRRYHWPNDPIPEGADYSMEQHVEDLKALLKTVDSTPVHLVGHSYGAFLCLLLAMRSPELLRSLVLPEPPVVTLFVSNRPGPGELLRLLFTRPRTAIGILKFGAMGIAPATSAAKKDDKEKALRAFGTAVLGKEAFRKMPDERKNQSRDNLIKEELLGSGLLPLDEKEVRSVRVPTLLITGENSPRLFHRLVDRLEELLRNTERVTVENASHIMHENNPAAYNEAVGEFLRRNE